MMQEEKVLCHGQTVYFPRAAYRYFAIVTTMLSVLGLMCLGGLLFNQENFTLSPAAFFLLYSVCCTLLTKVLYDAAHLSNKSANSMRMHVEDSIVLRNAGTKAAADFFEELKAFCFASQSCQ